MAEELRLEVREFKDLSGWRWVLTDAAGGFLVDHEVRLDPASWQSEAFADLPRYVSWHAAADRYREDEERIVARLGSWAGDHVLGPPIAAALARAARRGPVTVRVVVPPEARGLLFQPLEVARIHGKPLAEQDIALVMQTGSADGFSPAVGGLRVLGLFSLPEGGQPLNLRRERHELVRLVRRIAASGKSADVRVLQYGVTRDRLREVLEEAEGWDIIHISGHGSPGELLLETAAGMPDRVPATALANMLDLVRGRVRLVTVSACWSAAEVTAEQRRFFGLPASQERLKERIGGDSRFPGALATELSERLGCAVLAMRFPVTDEFAIALSYQLYRLLAEKGQPLPRAVSMALRQLRLNEYPALSVAAPAIFGETAVGLTLASPPRRPGEGYYDTRSLKMAGFPPQPERFVGRTAVMARASAALAAESGIPGVLLYGMPGGGKTACALELAYTHEHAFDRLVWYKAPDECTAVDGALTDLVLTLERKLDGFQMARLVADQVKLAAFLPQLTELMRQRRLLLVIDNIESLLSEGGEWRDQRWGQVIGALTGHAGLGRLIVTGRERVALTGIQGEAVDALSASEGLLLARELPNLRKLIRGELPGIEPDMARNLALGIFGIAQGHPKLLELAEGQAASPERLAALIRVGGEAWQAQGGLPADFFTSGESRAVPGNYLHILATWTRVVTEILGAAERAAFWFLCCLEEPDREQFALEAVWPRLWSRLDYGGEPPALNQTLTAVVARGLITADEPAQTFTIHPGVASAGRADAGKPFRKAVDAEAADVLLWVFRYASGEGGLGPVDTELAVRAGPSAATYLIRMQRWAEAAAVLVGAFLMCPSPANAAAMLSDIELISSHDPSQAGDLARIVRVLDPAAAEMQLRRQLDASRAAGDYRVASMAAGRLTYICLRSGRLEEALALAGQAAGYSQQAHAGPWSQVFSEIRKLDVLNEMGQSGQVLTEIDQLRERMQGLPDTRGTDEMVEPWAVREQMLATGREAARRVHRWNDALEMNAAVIASMRERRAPAAVVSKEMYNDYQPLLRLGRVDDALNLLQDCRQAFTAARDIEMLSRVLGALADTEDMRGHGEAAIRLAHDGLRYAYLAEDVTNIAVIYHNLGAFLANRGWQPASALASFLASALIGELTEITCDCDPFLAAVITLFKLDARPPSDTADLCRQLGDIPGTDLAALIARLSHDPGTAERALGNLIARATELASRVTREE